MAKTSLRGWLLAACALASAVCAQPSPEVQQRIVKAILAANTSTGQLDYTAFANPFIGTGAVTYGDVW